MGVKNIHSSPLYPQTQGKIECYHRSTKNVVKLENYFAQDQLRKAITEFVHYYHNQRYHEALRNVTPADAFFQRDHHIIKSRQLIKRRTIDLRRKLYLKNKSLLN